MANLPPNVHVSTHPCLQAKLGQLRSRSADSKAVQALVHEIALIVACEALAKNLTAAPGPSVRTRPLVLPIRALASLRDLFSF